MKQEILIQLLALIIVASLTLFYNPFAADIEGKIIFSAIIIVMIFVFIIFDIYKSIEDNKIRIKLFNEKLNLYERIKNLENFKKDIENEKK